MKRILSPSVLSADFAILGEQLALLKKCGVTNIHYDVMDGMYVPSISFGMPVLKSIRQCTDLVLDVHMMVVDPDRYVEDFRKSGADIITVHAEACTHLDRVVNHIKETGAKAAVALNPATPLSALEYVLPELDMALLMTVNPGFGGQKLIPGCVQKISEIRRMLDDAGCDAIIEVDGGVNTQTAPMLVRAGATLLVAGSALYGAEDARAFIETVKKG